MGQKVNPIGLRLGISRTWNSKWFAEKDYASQLKQDLDIQKFVKARLKHAAISKIEVERTAKKTKVNIFSARPGIIIGRKGDEVERLKNELSKRNPHEVVVNIANQLERRIAYRRAVKRSIQAAMRMNIAGCKVMVGGRLNGAEIARTEWVREGQVRLHTLRVDIDYGVAEANTTYGIIGVKVWVYRGEDYGKSRGRRSYS